MTVRGQSQPSLKLVLYVTLTNLFVILALLTHPTPTLTNLLKVGYCDRRIALWTKYKTDLAIRMLPSEVRGRSGSYSGSMISTAMNRAIAVAIKPRSRIASQSRSQVESSVYVDTADTKSHVSTRTVDVTPRVLEASTNNPYSSNKDAVGTSNLFSVKNSQRKENSLRAGGGGAEAARGLKASTLGTIQSGDTRTYHLHHHRKSHVLTWLLTNPVQ